MCFSYQWEIANGKEAPNWKDKLKYSHDTPRLLENVEFIAGSVKNKLLLIFRHKNHSGSYLRKSIATLSNCGAAIA